MVLATNDWIDLWAEYYKKNPEQARKLQAHFINAELEMKNTALTWFAKQAGAREKFSRITGITNPIVLDTFCKADDAPSV